MMVGLGVAAAWKGFGWSAKGFFVAAPGFGLACDTKKNRSIIKSIFGSLHL